MLGRTARLEVLALALIVTALAASEAKGVVRKGYLTSPVHVGEVATLVVDVSPSAPCTVSLRDGTATGAPSELPAKSGPHLTWRWRVSKTAPPGVSVVVVSCGRAGTLRAKLTVVGDDPEPSLTEAVARICRRVPWAVTSRFGTFLVSVPSAPLNGCRFRVGMRAAPEFLAYYSLFVVRTETCHFAVSTRLSVVRQPDVGRYPGPFGEYYTVTCGSLG